MKVVILMALLCEMIMYQKMNFLSIYWIHHDLQKQDLIMHIFAVSMMDILMITNLQINFNKNKMKNHQNGF